MVWAGRPVLAFAVVPLSQCFSASPCLFPSGHAFPIQASHLCFFLSHVGQLFPSNLNPPLASSLRSAQSQQRFCRFGHLSLRCLILCYASFTCQIFAILALCRFGCQFSETNLQFFIRQCAVCIRFDIESVKACRPLLWCRLSHPVFQIASECSQVESTSVASGGLQGL